MADEILKQEILQARQMFLEDLRLKLAAAELKNSRFLTKTYKEMIARIERELAVG